MASNENNEDRGSSRHGTAFNDSKHYRESAREESALSENTSRSDEYHTSEPILTEETTPLAVTGFLPVSGALGGSPAGMGFAGSNYAGPTLYGIVAPLGQISDADQRIANDAEIALAEEPTLSPDSLSGIRIAVRDGSVELTGHVASNHDRLRAAEVCAGLSGALHVENHLEVAM